ncbi:MAG: DEAD/DEAH box helicase, partial [Blastocatellia bacterium]
MEKHYESYEQFFGDVFAESNKQQPVPFAYQRQLAEATELPALVNVPTGAGKTKAILGAWLWRRLTKPESVGRRLIYCLPMRTLVEQTRDVAKAAIKNLEEQGLIEKDRFRVHVLMGGDVTDEWDSWPERECILIGTQDMLLSRALNRGYAMSRFRWPLHFGLLNNDCLWVFDEVQLMSDGLATTAQLAAFRDRFQAFGHAHSIWMSATLDREWLKMVDFKSQVDGLQELILTDTDREAPLLAQRLTAVKHLQAAPPDCRLPQGLAAFIKANHQPGRQTLVVVNRVARARETFSYLRDMYAREADKPEIKLIHSRFRPEERKQWKQLFDSKT